MENYCSLEINGKNESLPIFHFNFHENFDGLIMIKIFQDKSFKRLQKFKVEHKVKKNEELDIPLRSPLKCYDSYVVTLQLKDKSAYDWTDGYPFKQTMGAKLCDSQTALSNKSITKQPLPTPNTVPQITKRKEKDQIERKKSTSPTPTKQPLHTPNTVPQITKRKEKDQVEMKKSTSPTPFTLVEKKQFLTNSSLSTLFSNKTNNPRIGNSLQNSKDGTNLLIGGLIIGLSALVILVLILSIVISLRKVCKNRKKDLLDKHLKSGISESVAFSSKRRNVSLNSSNLIKQKKSQL